MEQSSRWDPPPEIDTRRFTTHAQWCRYLGGLPHALAIGHRRCQFQDRCVCHEDIALIRRLTHANA